jgi:hypothetical protein
MDQRFPDPGGRPPDGFRIDCDTCVARHSDACDDCVVTFLCNREPGEAIVIPVEEVRALRLLGDAGLVPRLRHRAAG